MKITQCDKSFPSATGLCAIRYRMWIPEDPRIAVQLTHGMAEYIDRYADFAMFLAQNGVLVYGQDHASHGKSRKPEQPRGYFGPSGGWDALITDMRTLLSLVKADYPALPYILFGHSMGSFLARAYAGRHGSDFDAYIFSGTAGKNPVLGIGKLLARREIKKTGGGTPSKTLYAMSFGAYNNAFRPNRTLCDWLTRDEAVIDKYIADEDCGFPFTACGMLDLFDGLGEISSADWAARVPDKPILLMSGDMDPVGNRGKGVKQVFGWLNRSRHKPELKLYPGGRHEMLNETNRLEAYGDVLLFVEAVAAQGELK